MSYVYQLQNAYNAAFDSNQIIKEKKCQPNDCCGLA